MIKIIIFYDRKYATTDTELLYPYISDDSDSLKNFKRCLGFP